MIQKFLNRIQKSFLIGEETAKKEGEETPKKKLTITNCLISEFDNFKIVFDIGTYQGSFVDEFLTLNSEISFHCFEPSKESYQNLENKYKLSNKVKINHCAVSDYSGSATLNINSFKETNSLLEAVPINKKIDQLTQKQSTEIVEVISLNEYCLKNGINDIDLVKIDTQGNSFNVLKGSDSLLSSKKVKFLYIEAEFIEIYKGEKLFSEIEILMRSFDYYIVDLFNMNYVNEKKLAWCDVLFAHLK
jgi:FkbM family methyltransferase